MEKYYDIDFYYKTGKKVTHKNSLERGVWCLAVFYQYQDDELPSSWIEQLNAYDIT